MEESELTNCDEERRRNCLICNDFFDLNSSSTTSSLGGDTEKNEQLLAEWKTTFQIFSTLLSKLDGNEEGGDNENHGLYYGVVQMFEKSFPERVFHPPCCSGCAQVLFEIAKLQKRIDENKKMQHDRVLELEQKLKNNYNYTCESQDDFFDSSFCEDRIDSDNECHYDSVSTRSAKPDFEGYKKEEDAPKTTSAKRKRGRPRREPQATPAKHCETTAKEDIKPCTVLLERCKVDGCISDGNYLNQSPTHRRSELKASELVKNSGESVGNEGIPLKAKRIKLKSVSKDESTKKGDPKPKVKRKRKKIDKLNKSNRQSPSNFFLLLTDDYLIFKRTIVKVRRCESLECLDCSWKVTGMEYESFQEMRRHITEIHTESSSQLHECPLCQKSYPGSSLKGHFTEAHQIELSSLICEACWRSLSIRGNLRVHMWLHKNEVEKNLAISKGWKDYSKNYPKTTTKPLSSFPCPTCGNVFSSPRNLMQHEQTHLPRDQRKQFECDYCHVKLLNKTALQSHIERRHRPDLASRQRICPHCDKKYHYNDGGRYAEHVMRHTNERPFVCDTCGASFTTKDTLKDHIMKVHVTTEREYQCEFCELAYRHKKGLVQHQRTRHTDKLKETEALRKFTHVGLIGPKAAYPCEICGKVFEFPSRLRKHLNTAHHPSFKEELPD